MGISGDNPKFRIHKREKTHALLRLVNVVSSFLNTRGPSLSLTCTRSHTHFYPLSHSLVPALTLTQERESSALSLSQSLDFYPLSHSIKRERLSPSLTPRHLASTFSRTHFHPLSHSLTREVLIPSLSTAHIATYLYLLIKYLLIPTYKYLLIPSQVPTYTYL